MNGGFENIVVLSFFYTFYVGKSSIGMKIEVGY